MRKAFSLLLVAVVWAMVAMFLAIALASTGTPPIGSVVIGIMGAPFIVGMAVASATFVWWTFTFIYDIAYRFIHGKHRKGGTFDD